MQGCFSELIVILSLLLFFQTNLPKTCKQTKSHDSAGLASCTDLGLVQEARSPQVIVPLLSSSKIAPFTPKFRKSFAEIQLALK